MDTYGQILYIAGSNSFLIKMDVRGFGNKLFIIRFCVCSVYEVKIYPSVNASLLICGCPLNAKVNLRFALDALKA